MNTSLKLRLTAALTMLVAAVALAACGSSCGLNEHVRLRG